MLFSLHVFVLTVSEICTLDYISAEIYETASFYVLCAVWLHCVVHFCGQSSRDALMIRNVSARLEGSSVRLFCPSVPLQKFAVFLILYLM
jgi:hypothetical protein